MHCIMVNATIKDIYNEASFVDHHKVYYIIAISSYSSYYLKCLNRFKLYFIQTYVVNTRIVTL